MLFEIKKVLKFKVDYNYIKPEINKYREAEKAVGQELDEKKLKKMEKELLLHPERIATITEYLLRVYNEQARIEINIILISKNNCLDLMPC